MGRSTASPTSTFWVTWPFVPLLKVMRYGSKKATRATWFFELSKHCDHQDS